MKKRKGLLVRVGIDKSFGGYNAPINPITNDYLYMPIPQGRSNFREGMLTSYDHLTSVFSKWMIQNHADLQFPKHLLGVATHLDPDFEHLTYGDQNTGRGLRVGKLNPGDFLVFFASFNPIAGCEHKLVYALFGLMVVDKVIRADEVSQGKLNTNAHTRIQEINSDHWVVVAEKETSGRFDLAIPIGEYRNRAYRVRKDLLGEWGGLGVNDGYIQRSVCPPWYEDAGKFWRWLDSQSITKKINNWE